MLSTIGYKYRYGFNGMEKDDEAKGVGNSYTTEFRQYDPRLGRWLSIDPKASSMPWQSPYISMDNNPIRYNDVLGDSIGLSKNFLQNKTAMRAMQEYLGTKEGKEFASRYAKAGQEIAGVKFEKDGDLHSENINLNFDYARREGKAGGGNTQSNVDGVYKQGGILKHHELNTKVTLFEGKGWATDNWTFNTIITIFHETFIHVRLDTEDFLDDKTLNNSNISKEAKASAGGQDWHYHHREIALNKSTLTKNPNSIWPNKALNGLMKIAKDWNLNYKREQIKDAIWNASGF